MAVYLLKDNPFDRRMQIASLISKNNEGELNAIKGYQELLSIIRDDFFNSTYFTIFKNKIIRTHWLNILIKL